MVRRLFTRRSCFVFLLVLQCHHGQALAQEADIDGLTDYLKQKTTGPEPIKRIIQHLEDARGKDALTELVSWAKSGFPDLQDKTRGYWVTEASSFELGVFHSITYYIGKLPLAEQTQTYLSVLEQLSQDYYLSYLLTVATHRFVSEPVLKREAQKLMQSSDAKQREHGVLMAQALVAKDPSVKEQFIQMLQHDDSIQVRITVLYGCSPSRLAMRESGLLHLDRLLNDPSERIRRDVAERLRYFTTTPYSPGLEIADLIDAMLSTEDPFLRTALGRTVAEMSAGSHRTVDTWKFTDEFLKGFVRLARSTPRPGDPEKAKEALAQTWTQWWTPLIPAYSKSRRQVLESRDTLLTKLEALSQVCEWVVLGRFTEDAPGSQAQGQSPFAGTIEVKRSLKGKLETHRMEVELPSGTIHGEDDAIWFVRRRKDNGRYLITVPKWDKIPQGEALEAISRIEKHKTRVPNMPKPTRTTTPISVSLAFDDGRGRALTRIQTASFGNMSLLVQFENHVSSRHSVSPPLDGSSSGRRYPHYDLEVVDEKGAKVTGSWLSAGCGNLNSLRTRDIIPLQPGEVFRTWFWISEHEYRLRPGTYRARLTYTAKRDGMLGDLPNDPYDYEFNELIQTVWEGTVTSNWVEIQIVG